MKDEHSRGPRSGDGDVRYNRGFVTAAGWSGLAPTSASMSTHETFVFKCRTYDTHLDKRGDAEDDVALVRDPACEEVRRGWHDWRIRGLV